MLRFHQAVLILGLLTIAACKKEKQPDPVPAAEAGQFKINVTHRFGNDSLQLEQPYTNANGEEVTFQLVRYYLSNIKLTKADGSIWSQPESYYLIDMSDPTSTAISLTNVPAGTYTGLSYIIGVDSTRNVSGAQTGALSVSNNMFWSWNSGYIFAKLEGTSPQSPVNSFTYHLGGFEEPNVAYGTVTHEFGADKLIVAKNAEPLVNLISNLAQVFIGPNQVSVATLYGVSSPDAKAKRIAENFRAGFLFESIQ